MMDGITKGIIAFTVFSVLFASGCASMKSKKSVKSTSQWQKSSSYERVFINASDHANICEIFRQKPRWYASALSAQKRWGIPIHVMMSIMKQESSFRAKARPPKRQKASVFGRSASQSSAYGYAQAKTGTWRDYQKQTKQSKNRRDNFSHAIDFIGWYGSVAVRILKLKNYDTYSIYLSYHEGLTGFKRQSYQKKPWLLRVAKKVKNYGFRYYNQLQSCASEFTNGYKTKNKKILVVENRKTPKKKSTRSSFSNNAKRSVGRSIKTCPKVLGFWEFCKPFTD